jgi:hypothetical protein
MRNFLIGLGILILIVVTFVISKSLVSSSFKTNINPSELQKTDQAKTTQTQNKRPETIQKEEWGLGTTTKSSTASTYTLYKNSQYGYTIKYPAKWSTVHLSPSGGFMITNNKWAIIDQEGSPQSDTDSLISVTSLQTNHTTIDEVLKDPAFWHQGEQNGYSDSVRTMVLGGKFLRVLVIKTDAKVNYCFVYKHGFTCINLHSGSPSEFIVDQKVFTDVLRSLIIS